MAAVRAKDTKPEMTIRRGLHALGYRYLLHVKDLPGKPDLVFPKYNLVLFVNGCFWHGHNCSMFKWPMSRETFWKQKISGNVQRDISNERKLAEQGWRIGVVWECAIRRANRASGVDGLLTNVERQINSTVSYFWVSAEQTQRHSEDQCLRTDPAISP